MSNVVVREDSVSFSCEGKDFKMSFMVDVYYHNSEEICYSQNMVAEFNGEHKTMDFRNDDDFYGQGMHFNFTILEKFKVYLQSNGVEV